MTKTNDNNKKDNNKEIKKDSSTKKQSRFGKLFDIIDKKIKEKSEKNKGCCCHRNSK